MYSGFIACFYVHSSQSALLVSSDSVWVADLVFILPADINECEQFGICPQSCRNSKGSYECFCADGFKSMSSHYGERCAANGMMGLCLEQVTSGGHKR